MKRRNFIVLIGSAAVAWPVAARAQQVERARRIGLLTGLAESEPSIARNIQEFRLALEKLGWIEGQNLQLTIRYAAGDIDQARVLARELVGQQPDLIVGHTTPVAAALQQATHTIPVILVSVTDPVANGFVTSLARPGGNITGFTNYEFGMGAKWLEILRQIAPGTRRVSLMLNPDTGSYYVNYLHSVESVAVASAVQATLTPVRDAREIEAVIVALGREAGGGLIVLPSAPITVHIPQIIELAARYRVPAVYPFRTYAAEGGLVSYGVDLDDLFRRAADYVDRVLKGNKPAELPVQAPTKFELVINLKAAKAQGLTVPPKLLALADDVIE
ncbi:MAG TPA: ABC transporter substrate-binding protein [Bradyrhizobium sp.]|uniref:ABC transporter substrate-binding protein n=1 Tax=Bradyrhizobium sp. TaxID=376 RepID=UPI002C1E7629|nr:ABC transporter substrate-binding protein [Bradyrhizobium sp.]HLZ06569.1 ABC transporter substrate-binding protein [Bradyrhizobium sp.]